MQTDEELSKTKNLVIRQIIVKMNGKGRIHIGENNVIHPWVRFMSEGGDIRIGSKNIFEEKTVIYNKSSTNPMVIGDENYFKIGSKIYSSNIEDLNEFGINCHVDESRIGTGNLIADEVKVKLGETLLEKKSYALNGNVIDNLAFSEKRKAMIILMIRNTTDAYKNSMSKVMDRSKVVPSTTSVGK